MKHRADPDDYDLKAEYDLSEVTVVPRGRFDPKRRVGKNVIVLAPELSERFPTDESVNEALRLVLRIAEVPRPKSRRAARS
jgi:hypothetical protein